MENKQKTAQKQETKEETITIKKQDLWKYSTFLLLGVVVILGVVIMMGGGAPTGNVVADNLAPTEPAPAAVQQIKDADLEAFPIKGDPNAPVTIIEFSDYECPFCGRFYQQTLPVIDEEYIKSGQVKLLFGDFPLSFHPNAMPAAVAARCVREQGGDEAYFLMHDKIFENQQSLNAQNLELWAQELGYDLSACDSAKLEKEAQAVMQFGSSLGIRGTPGFLVGTEAEGYITVSGAQPAPVFEQAIQQYL